MRSGRTLPLALGLMSSILCAQELDPKDPALIDEALGQANAVVIGEFKMNWCLPWFNGWHCSGRILVEEKLFDDPVQSGEVFFYWTEPFRRPCFFCEQLSRRAGQKGIWFLSVENGELKSSGSPGISCGGPLPMDARFAVIEAVQRKKLRKVEPK